MYVAGREGEGSSVGRVGARRQIEGDSRVGRGREDFECRKEGKAVQFQ